MSAPCPTFRPGPKTDSSSSCSSPVSQLWISFRQIDAEQTINLRKTVLWPSIPLSKQLDPSYDLRESTVHLGAFLHLRSADDPSSLSASSSRMRIPITIKPDSTSVLHDIEEGYLDGNEPIGIMTLTQQSYSGAELALPNIGTGNCNKHIQLRKFAILPRLQGQSIGRQFLLHAIEYIKSNYPDERILCHFDARVSQRKFYERCGMKVLDEKSFWKFGSTGQEPGVEYIKMGNIV
ncbi:uncharacterized protein I303_108508 [Kwoniella dejecticola CBS 10117]|uniref:N-acetyltransferase domain-containing protein n=1 Tax=Kwoniella dejecticola CBS 10117 TaxID=1296121 RepID=A0A1A5ZX77_9TREE|nr:uncharacterized protein I303_07168 [Kwoniella dejecticola CBS 10117]OBR82409.1 hypothetical protein I303_07168 [Kwoniella dejecticola CBS 10117]